MTGATPQDIPVNVLDVALRVLSEPAQPVAVSMVEAYAMCLYVLRQNHLPMPTDRPVFGGNDLPASLAAGVAQVIAAHDALSAIRAAVIASPINDDALARQLADQIEHFNAAFAALKARFEQEFPHG